MQDVHLPSISTERDDWRMLQQQEHIFDSPLLSQFHEGLLQMQRGAVVYRPELQSMNHAKR